MMTDTEIRKQITDTENEVKNLEAAHMNMVQSFQNAVAQNKARHSELVGSLVALRQVLGAKPEKGKKNARK